MLSFTSSLILLFGTSAFGAPGDHLRIGEVTITPDLDLGLEYRSNAFRTEVDPQGSAAFRVAPGVAISGTTQSVQVQIDGEYAFRKFVALGNPGELGDDTLRDQRSNLDRFNEFKLAARLSAFRDRPVGVSLGNRAVLRNNPSDVDIDSDDPYATQIRNTLDGSIDARPGPALTMGFGGHWTHAVFFIPTNDTQREALNLKDQYGADARLSWQFLAKTAFVVNAGYAFNAWRDSESDVNGTSFPVPDSQVLRLDTGIQGQVTERLRVIARVGFGTQLFESGPNLQAVDGVLLTLQADYKPAEGHTLTAGYRKTFTDSFFTNSLALNAVYARWRGTYAERVTSFLEGGLRAEGYAGSTERNDLVMNVNAGVDVRALDWMRVGASGGVLQRSSTDDTVEYTDARVLAGVTFVY